jgi:hypothetical protein
MNREIIKAFTVLWLFGMYIVLLLTFTAAYQAPDKVVTVAIDHAGEAEVEFFMLMGALFVTTMGTAFIITDMKKDLSERVVRNIGEEIS